MVHRVIVRGGRAVLFAALAIVIFAFALAYWALERDARVGAEQTLELFRQHLDAFVEDRAYLSAHPTLQGIGHSADAGAFLNERVRWSLPDDDEPAPANAPLAVSEPVSTWLREHFRKREAAVPEEVMALDTGWMLELHRYDHWDVGRAKHTVDRDGYDLFAGATPHYLDLVDWAKLRALRAFADGDFTGAHQDIVQLARLCLSTETVLGGMIANAILSTDRLLHERAQAEEGAAPNPSWQPFSVADGERLRRTLFASLQRFGAFTPDAYWGAIPIENVIDCVGVQEGLAGMHRLRPLVEPVLPARYEDAGRMLAKARDRCSFSRLHDAWGAPASVPPDHGCALEDLSPPFDWMCIKLRVATRVPGLREVAVRSLQRQGPDSVLGLAQYGATDP